MFQLNIKKQLVFIAIVLSSLNLLSQQLSWDLITDGTGVSDHQELTCQSFIAGSGVSSFAFGTTGATGKSWSLDVLDINDYFEVSFVSSALDTFQINSIYYSERRSSTAIHIYELRYSSKADFATYTSLGTVNVPDDDLERDTIINYLNILVLPQDTFYLRWYGYAAESSAGTWRINDGSLNILLSTYVEDRTAPELVEAKVLDAQTIQLSFNESLDSNSISNADFSINQSVNPSYIDKSLSHQGKLILDFNQGLPIEQLFKLYYQNISDHAGNTILNEEFVELSFYEPQAFGVLINEILADPTPQIYLPDNEYVELYNTKNFPINLENWKLTNNSSQYTFPNCLIEANGYLLIVPEGKSGLYDSTLNVIEFNFGSLTNSGAKLALYSKNGEWIHQVNYSDTWHTESYKKDGGWSLEMIDPNQACNMFDNWSSSVSNLGGTPGKENSIKGVNTGGRALEILNAYFDTTNIILQFNQYLSPDYQINLSKFILEQTNPTIGIYNKGEDFISLSFPDVFDENVVYQLTINDTIKTCDDRWLDIPTIIDLGKPVLVDSNDVVINEVLFNPTGSNKIFIEFFNRSSKILDLQEMKLAIIDNGALIPKNVISAVPQIIFPNDYFVLTKDRDNVLSQFYVKSPDRLFNSEELPSISTTEEYLFLLNKGDKIIDEIYYSADFHNPILSQNEGVSLEKINPESSGLTASAWQSASQQSGFATPTYKNSQYSEISISGDDMIQFESESFSPDMDGYNDYLIVNYKLEKGAYQANVKIYNARGQFVYDLVVNEFTGKQGQWIWDGRDANGHSSPLGIYILAFEFIHSDGEVIQKKEVCTLAGKL